MLPSPHRIDAWLREHDRSDYVGTPLTISADDPHPSPLLHGLWADTVFAKLEQLGWLLR